MQMNENVLTFQKLGHTGGGEFYIDLAESMSIVNRKLNKQQGLHSVIAMNVFVEDTVTGLGVEYSVAVSGAPRTWMTRNALVKAEALWLRQQKEALETSPTISPRWSDFKVWLNDGHRTGTVLTPISGHMFGGVDAYIAGEWIHSKIVYERLDAANLVVQSEPELHIVGDDNGNTNKGLILQYANSRARVLAPDPGLSANVDTTIYALGAGPFGEHVETIIENMEDDNNEPPYSKNEYSGSDINGHEPLLYSYGTNSTTLKRKLNLNGFSVPNGVMELQVQLAATAPNPADVYIQIVVGKTRDY